MLKSLAFFTLEKGVNFVLARDEDSPSRLAKLEDKTVCIDFTDINLKMFWIFEQQRVRIVTELNTDADVTIAGTLQAISRMGLSKAKVAKDLTVSGDMHVVETFKQLFAELDIDLAEQLAPFVGDAAAFKLEKTAKQASHFVRHAAKSFAGSSKEYLEEEINVLLSKQRLADFSTEVRETSRGVDRLQARVKRLLKA